MKHFILAAFVFIIVFSFGQDQRSTLKAGQAPFFHGVASGDPMADKVIIWTKVTPPNGNGDDIDVYWQMATDVNFTNVVNFGKTTAVSGSDYTVKLDVCGLQGATYYYYAFHALGQNSITGRTKTAPATGGNEARFGVVSCSSYEHGFFNAYESMSERNDLDAIIHLGDYIYEYASGGFSSSVVTDMGRTYQPTTEVITLSDYRIRHSHYKLDDQLQMLHQVHPFITTWDDHETANDAYKDGAQNHDPGTEGPWIDRKISGTQAYKEYMPIRNPDPNNDVKIWRKLRYGNLLDLIILDSRLWARDEQDIGQTNNSNHKLLGDDQFLWLEAQLADPTTQWKIISQQVMMAPLEILSQPVNADQWDGYNADRNRLINFIENNNVQNPVVLTGDIHTSWVNNIPGNNTNTAAVEFVVTSVTSPGLDVIETALGQLPQWLLDLFGGAVTGVITGSNPHMEYVNIDDHGYMVFTVNSSKAQGDYVWLEREVIDTSEEAGPSYFTSAGSSNMQGASTPMPNPPGGAPLPPFSVDQNMPFAMLLDTFEINVVEGQFSNQCFLNIASLCPNVITSVLSNPQFGTATLNQFCVEYEGITNYYGEDFMLVTFCQTASPTECDTVVLQFNVQPTSNIDTLVYQASNFEDVTDCVSFDDLVGSSTNVTIINNNVGNLTIDANNCFTYAPDSTFNGIHYIGLIACDSLNVCDTVILQFEISGVNNTMIVELFGDAEELISSCMGFDDLQGSIASSGIVNNGGNSALIFGDTCISYISQSSYFGVDTILFYACDNSVPPICDTIEYWIHITNDTISDTTGITDPVNSDFVVMGVYPNPFDVEILVQYYQFNQQTLNIALYDVAGKLIFSQGIGEKSTGLKYARLETSELAKGNYIVEISSDEFSYAKKVVKY